MVKLIVIISLFLLLLSCQDQTDNNNKVLSKPQQGDYWQSRYTYPTGQFNPLWYKAARKTHQKNTTKTPKGSFLKNSRTAFGGINIDSFTALGPKPLINSASSKSSGRTNVIVSHPSNASIAYIGVDGGGIWKTSNCCDNKTTWTNITDATTVNGNAIGDLHLDPNNPDIIYAGTGDLRYGSYSFGSSGVLRSKDAGSHWQVLGEEVFAPYREQANNEFPQYQAIGKVRTNPNNSQHIVVGTKTGIFFSFDDGLNWTGPCLTNAHSSQRQDTTGLEVSAAGEIYAAIGTRGHNTPVQPDLNQNGANGIYKTNFPSSGCPNWNLITTVSNGWPAGTGDGAGFPNNSIGRIDIAMAPSDNEYIYAQVASITTRAVRGVWKTVNGGTSWTQVATTNDFIGCDDSGTQAWYDMGMSVSPVDPDEIFLSAVDLFKSSNGGSSFTNSTCGYAGGPNTGDFVHVDHHARTYVAGDPTKILVGSDGGVFFASNADASNPRDISYSQLNDSINTMEFYSGDISANFANSMNKSIVAGAQDNGSSVASWDTNTEDLAAKGWQSVSGGDGIYATLEPIISQRVYVESQRGNMRISTSGINGPFNRFVSPWSGDDVVPFIFPFHLNKHDCSALICEQLMAGTNRIWETVNGGLNNSDWYINSPDLSKATLQNRSIINQMHYGISDASIAVVGSNDGNFQFGFGMGGGIANSANWVDVTGGNKVLPNRPILDVVTAANTATTAYAAVGGFNENTPLTPGHLFEVICNADCSTFSWSDKTGNLPNIPVDSVMVNPNIIGMVFAGTDWGLYYTEDISQASPTWFRFTAGLPSVMIWDMTIDRGATTLALFTRSRGAYVWPLPTSLLGDLIFANSFE